MPSNLRAWNLYCHLYKKKKPSTSSFIINILSKTHKAASYFGVIDYPAELSSVSCAAGLFYRLIHSLSLINKDQSDTIVREKGENPVSEQVERNSYNQKDVPRAILNIKMHYSFYTL